MRGRVLKNYFAVTAIAALCAVGMGIYLSFVNGQYDVYCDFEVAAERAYLETRWGPCRPRIGLIVAVFGRIFLVLLTCFWLPVGLFLWLRRKYQALELHPCADIEQRAPVPDQKAGIGSSPSRAESIADRIERWTGPFSAGYFTVSAFCVFQYVGFAAWVNLLHNAGASYCEYDNTDPSGSFYSSSGLCKIEWIALLEYWFVLTFVLTAILCTPIVLLGAFCVARQLSRDWRSRRR